MMRRTFGLLAMGALGLVLGPTTQARAQAPTDCASLAANLEHGRASAEAVGDVLRCPDERAAAITAFFQRHSQTTDTAVLSEAVAYAGRLHDARLFSTWSRIAATPGAAVEARAFSLLGLINLLGRTTTISYADLTSVVEGACQVGYLTIPAQPIRGTPLPATAPATARRLARHLLEDPATPPEVRSAASCLRVAALVAEPEAVHELDEGAVTPPPDLSLITLTNPCGTVVELGNGNPQPIAAELRIVNTTFQVPTTLGPAMRGSAHPLTGRVWLPYTGMAELSVDGRMVARVAVGGPPCE